MKTIFFALALIPSISYANFYDGNDLRSWSMALTKSNLGNRLSVEEAANASLFQGYVAGVYEIGEDVSFCTKDRTRLIQLTDTVTNYINNHPESRNLSAATLTGRALIEAFPCNN